LGLALPPTNPAERWIGSSRQDSPDHVIVLSERHLKRPMNEYLAYYHEDRTHLGLGKQTPMGKKAVGRVTEGGTVLSLPGLGGLHHRHDPAA
jgi:putative transposase